LIFFSFFLPRGTSRWGGCHFGVGVVMVIGDEGKNYGWEVTRGTQQVIAGLTSPRNVFRVDPRVRWRSKFAPGGPIAGPLEMLL
jgi:hypothetical protein